MLDDTNIIQTNQGSTGASAPVTTFDMTLPSAVTDGNTLLVVATHLDPNKFVLSPDDNVWLTIESASTASPVPSHYIKGVQAPGGSTTFTFTVSGVGDIVCWFIMEVSGLTTMLTDYDVNGLATNRPCGADLGGSGSVNSGAGTTTCTTQVPANINQYGDDLVLCCGAGEIASGTPPLLSSIADTTGGQPGTWARLGSTVATSRASGSNIRLDVFRKYTGGVLFAIEATYTWASAVAGASAGLALAKGAYIPPQQTLGRAATNSTM